MSPGSAGPHRAFIGVASTLCVCLVLSLIVGWQWFGNEVKRRNIIIERARVHEAKMKELERLGLDAEAGIMDNAANLQPTVNLRETTPRVGEGDNVVPLPSEVRELPLQETSDEFKEGVLTLEKYWKATNVAERLPHVYNAPRVEPLMRAYFEQQMETDPDHTQLMDKKRLLIDGVEMLYFSYKSSRPTGFVEVAMRRGDSGRFLIDWESLAGYCDVPFAKLKATKSAETVQVRSFVRLFEYYNYEFTDSDLYLCVKLVAPNGIDTLYGYCLRESELGHWLNRQLGSAEGLVNGYTLRVAFPENAQSDQCVWIHKVVASRWLILNNQ